jgi:hypothetical protein
MNFDKQPDPKFHFYTSIIKSIFRIAAGLFFITNNNFIAGILLIIAELLGILEELC